MSDSAFECRSMFKVTFSLDHIESEEAITAEKEAISRNLCDFRADDLTLDTS